MTTVTTRSSERGFTLIEVLVTLAILGYAIVGFSAMVGQSVDLAIVTKVNRQMRQLVDYQMGQITVGKLHPEEEDPFPDGQTGSFDDVGGYPEEYQAYSWELRREEIPICGTDEEELQKAGFDKAPGGTYARPQTDDILSGEDEHVEQPEGQFKSRVTLIVRWHGESADDDREFAVVTYLPVNGEEEAGARGDENAPASPADANAPGQSAGNADLNRSGAVNKEKR
jgi:prepilin-type N-terminal cleavage/methylation domain-containing protein